MLHTDVDPGSGFGYGHALIDESLLAQSGTKWLNLVRDHVTEHHMSYVLEGRRRHCISGSVVPR